MLEGHSNMSFRARTQSALVEGRSPRKQVTTRRRTRAAFCWLWLVFSMLALACGASPSKAGAAGENATPNISEDVPDSQLVDVQEDASDDADALRNKPAEAGDGIDDAFGVPSGILRAQAWPESDGNGSWRALEQGQGVFLTSESSGARTVVFSSLTDSMPAKGVLIEFPAELKPEEIPTLISVSLSPTPIRITRDAWPAIESLFRSAGIARVHALPGNRVYLAFERIERVSLLKLRLWVDAQRGRVGLGQVRLVHQRAQVNATAYQRIELTPLQDAETLPEDTGVLGTEGSITLPHRKRSQ